MKPQSSASKKHYSIETPSAILRPYRRHYVKEYHQWFNLYPELLYLTGSEPLTLEEEFTNHRSWLEDPTKYTFIVFSKNGRMIGDVNLFFSEWIEPNEAQINIMIAVPEYRGQGIAKDVLTAVQKFSKAVYGRDTIIAKIKDDNEASIHFFEKRGYTFVCHNSSFGEKEYRKYIEGDSSALLAELKDKLHLHETKDNLYNDKP